MPAAVVNEDDEVRQVRALDTAEIVRHLEAEAMILHVRQHLGMPLRDLAELLFPIAVQDNVVDVALAGVPKPSRLSRCEN